ncbi:IclR family transcriptional regulator [Sediminivirga luteola]|uniref:IclR family transcriptional regulator n=1 Tax=Sediminivirga luteola TaxID=1774748 RepID=A0A8J2XCU5_9MICO|nr:helix-turn-helix domain-containing protein [Sediminivirga luteola]GGA04553.1 hypothetical protein GCM10011333_03790 [Sediminivirga luteola]
MTAVNDAKGRGSLGTVRNAVLLLELLGQGPAYQQLTDLAERSGMSVPTVHRLLRSLVLADLVHQDPRSSRYSLGPELTRLSHRYLSRHPLLAALTPYLPGLPALVGGTVSVQMLVRGETVYADHADGPDSGPYRDSHRVHPALHTAGGRLIAARGGEEIWQQALQSCGPQTAQLADDARQDWAGADWLAAEGPDPVHAGEVAVPVVDATGATVAALSAAVEDPADESACAAVAAHLTKAARAAGRALGNG